MDNEIVVSLSAEEHHQNKFIIQEIYTYIFNGQLFLIIQIFPSFFCILNF